MQFQGNLSYGNRMWAYVSVQRTNEKPLNRLENNKITNKTWDWPAVCL